MHSKMNIKDHVMTATDEQLTARQASFVNFYGDPGSETFGNQFASAIKAGYSPKTAQAACKDILGKPRVMAAVEAKRAEIEASTQDKRERCLKVLDSIIDDEEAAARDRIRATEVRGRMCGWLSETRILETGPRQARLKQAELEVARRASLAVYDTKRLEDGTYAPNPPQTARPDQRDGAGELPDGPEGPSGRRPE